MSTITRHSTAESQYACEVVINSAVNTKPTQTAKECFKRKPFYMEYLKEKKSYAD